MKIISRSALVFTVAVLLAAATNTPAYGQDITVEFDNQYNGGTTSAGGKINVGGYEDDVPFPLDFAPSSVIQMYTVQDRLPEAQKTHKHLNWNGQILEYKMQHSEPLPQSYHEAYPINAKFELMAPVTLGVHFVDNTTSGLISFRDSWYLHSNIHYQPNIFMGYSSPRTYTGSYAETTEGGVFTDIGVDPNVSSSPYYSMRAPWLLAGNTKQPKTLPLVEGDWVCYGMFAPSQGHITATYDPFHQESGNITRAIKFLPDVTAVNAEYTGHRSSVNATPPTRTNSQRKIAKQCADYVGSLSAIHHSVYESQGKIFYIKTTNAGVSWSPEQLVSDYHKTSARPSIATAYHGYDQHVRYFAVEPEADVTYIVYLEGDEVVLKYKMNQESPDHGEWTEIARTQTAVPSLCTPVVAACMPVDGKISGGSKTACLIIWENFKGLKYSIYDDFQAAGVTLGGQQVVCENQTLRTGRIHNGSSIQPRYPSLSAPPHERGTGHTFSVAWNEFGHLYTKSVTLGCGAGGCGTLTLIPETFITPTAKSFKIKKTAAPSLTRNDMDTIIVYEYEGGTSSYPGKTNLPTAPYRLGSINCYPVSARYPSTPITGPVSGSPSGSVTGSPRYKQIVVRRAYQNSGWNSYNWSFVTTQNVSSLDPSIGSNFEATPGGRWEDKLRVSMNDGNSAHSITKFDNYGLNTSPQTNRLDGIDPNIPVRGEVLVEVFSQIANAPFSYSVKSSSLYLNKTTSVSNPIMKQLVIFNEDSSCVSYGICKPHVCNSSGTGTEIPWRATSDSVPNSENQQLKELFATDTFTVPSGGYIEYATDMFAAYLADFDSEPTIDVSFYSADSGNVVHTHSISASDLPTDSAMYVVCRIAASDIEDKCVYMTVGLSDTSSDMRWEVMHVAVIDELDLQKTASNPNPIPESISLEQNYPNPFNPSTKITYGIPEETDVKLAVYDMLGREVKILATGWKAPGTYTVSFNAEYLPSGMYLYRLETDKSIMSKKMMLMK